ncbi:MAG: hypothetical protein HY900_08270 [Deltaproteobacteria bacterium]|nr:hypothetical protein [Deltaproteobacteria bacterium]
MPVRKPGPMAQAAIRYFVLQFAGTAALVGVLLLVQQWIDVPPGVFWGLVGLWVAKDALLFPLVWRSYAPHEGHDRLIGALGEAATRLGPEGYVRIGAELWRAELEGTRVLEQGAAVRVRTRQGLKLLVEPKGEHAGVVDGRP